MLFRWGGDPPVDVLNIALAVVLSGRSCLTLGIIADKYLGLA